jgi:flavin-dependent dehydrogenase
MRIAKCSLSRTTSQFDLAVIGGGPAGTSAAITAARAGARVALLEARDLPRNKVCGEFVSAESLDLLVGLLADIPRAASVFADAPVIASTRLLFGRRAIEAAVLPAGLSIPRYDLDAMLWDAARHAGVETQSYHEVTTCDGDGPFTLQASSGCCSAKTVIVATGRWSQFSADRTLPPGPRWIGVKAHFHEVDPKACTDLYFFEGGYCGVQPITRDVVNACAMVRADCATSLQEVFRLHPVLAERAATWQAVTPQVSTAPLVYGETRPLQNNMMFVGDAAAFVDPFVGDGISIALRSGRVAAQCLSTVWRDGSSPAHAIAAYQREYMDQFAPLIAAAARVRYLFSLPEITKPIVFEMLRFPGLIPFVIRKTRSAK